MGGHGTGGWAIQTIAVLVELRRRPLEIVMKPPPVWVWEAQLAALAPQYLRYRRLPLPRMQLSVPLECF